MLAQVRGMLVRHRRSWRNRGLLALVLVVTTTTALRMPALTRRELSPLLLGALGLAAPPAQAFPNALPEAAKYADQPKRRGPMPKDLGLRVRPESDAEDVPELKVCGAAPNCFCTTVDDLDGGEHLIPLWAAPKGLARDAAWAQAVDAIKAYKPGQANVDGGGFGISDQHDYYALVQFESLKKGFIDDLEFALTTEAPFALRVRSASRVGFLDYAVNAKRLNYLSATLRGQGATASSSSSSDHRGSSLELGWDAPEITPKTHPAYWGQNAQ